MNQFFFLAVLVLLELEDGLVAVELPDERAEAENDGRE
jgi:hypothetical protein